jgi:hypothetical protein
MNKSLSDSVARGHEVNDFPFRLPTVVIEASRYHTKNTYTKSVHPVELRQCVFDRSVLAINEAFSDVSKFNGHALNLYGIQRLRRCIIVMRSILKFQCYFGPDLEHTNRQKLNKSYPHHQLRAY